jgi:hypothetical protein
VERGGKRGPYQNRTQKLNYPLVQVHNSLREQLKKVCELTGTPCYTDEVKIQIFSYKTDFTLINKVTAFRDACFECICEVKGVMSGETNSGAEIF